MIIYLNCFLREKNRDVDATQCYRIKFSAETLPNPLAYKAFRYISGINFCQSCERKNNYGPSNSDTRN